LFAFSGTLAPKEMRAPIDILIDEVPVNQREAFVLREIEGLISAQICKVLAVSIINFGVLIDRSRARLRECLELKGWGNDDLPQNRGALYCRIVLQPRSG